MSLPTPETIVEMVTGLVDGMDSGPCTLMTPVAYATMLDQQYVGGFVKTLRTRLLEIPQVKGIDTHGGKGMYLIKVDA